MQQQLSTEIKSTNCYERNPLSVGLVSKSLLCIGRPIMWSFMNVFCYGVIYYKRSLLRTQSVIS